MNKDRIIVPLDVPSVQEAIALLDQLPDVTFWKVGLELFVSQGAEILKILQIRQKRIFLDLKLHDIPNTMGGACRSVLNYSVDLLTLHIASGRNALNTSVQAIKTFSPRPQLLGITVLTSLTARDLAFDLKIPLELPDYALKMALLAQECGLDGAVCSPQEVAQLRQVCGRDFCLVCPGVRPIWSQSGDQKRVMTPTEAFKAGANYLVVGRPITQADYPKDAWQRICEEIASI